MQAPDWLDGECCGYGRKVNGLNWLGMLGVVPIQFSSPSVVAPLVPIRARGYAHSPCVANSSPRRNSSAEWGQVDA